MQASDPMHIRSSKLLNGPFVGETTSLGVDRGFGVVCQEAHLIRHGVEVHCLSLIVTIHSQILPIANSCPTSDLLLLRRTHSAVSSGPAFGNPQ